MAFGKFVLVHPGHILFLQRAKELADRLVVVVARDSSVRKERGEVILPEEQRREVIQALKPVDEALIGYEDDKYRVIEEVNPDIIVLGPDQEEDEGKLAYELEKRGINAKIVRMPRLSTGELHKTSKIVRKIREPTS